ncbi:MAG: type II toxin-antitoxin system PemK/MazF family toxin [Clostridia bacterium]|nr:type II toxin-antitoxin system PemK/MazF family toxin [Clostridia bacterium]
MENLVNNENDIEKIENTNDKNKKDATLSHVESSLIQLKKLMTNYTDNPDTISNADDLAYWIEDFCRYMNFKEDFKPNYLKTYNRGDIIKVNLGYNIGNEESGLHYCVVLDKNNPKSSGIITVVPLTSYKGKDMHFSSVFLKDEIYNNFKEKYDMLEAEFISKVDSVLKKQSDQQKIEEALKELNFLMKMYTQMSKMKKGSVALVSQITTISKQKILDPQKKYDILSGLRLSDESLDLINEKIKQLYVK